MIVRKRRGKNELMPLRVTEVEVRLCRKLGLTIEQYVHQHVLMAAKQRRWKWWFEKTRGKVNENTV